eukprot:jgi/Mesvir1/21167/Mv08927-RA.1
MVGESSDEDEFFDPPEDFEETPPAVAVTVLNPNAGQPITSLASKVRFFKNATTRYKGRWTKSKIREDSDASARGGVAGSDKRPPSALVDPARSTSEPTGKPGLRGHPLDTSLTPGGPPKKDGKGAVPPVALSTAAALRANCSTADAPGVAEVGGRLSRAALADPQLTDTSGGSGSESDASSEEGSAAPTGNARDAKSGREYKFSKVYMIKDLDSGRQFLVDEAFNAPGNADRNSSIIKDLNTGEELTLAEFERKLGISPLALELDRRERLSQGALPSLSGSSGDAVTGSQQNSNGGSGAGAPDVVGAGKGSCKGKDSGGGKVPAASGDAPGGPGGDAAPPGGKVKRRKMHKIFSLGKLRTSSSGGSKRGADGKGGGAEEVEGSHPAAVVRVDAGAATASTTAQSGGVGGKGGLREKQGEGGRRGGAGVRGGRGAHKRRDARGSGITPYTVNPDAPPSPSDAALAGCVVPSLGVSGSMKYRGPNAVKVGVHRKLYKDLTAVSRTQELRGHEGPVWAMKFSPDGAYLASAGQDRLVRVWQVTANHVGEERPRRDPGEAAQGGGGGGAVCMRCGGGRGGAAHPLDAKGAKGGGGGKGSPEAGVPPKSPMSPQGAGGQDLGDSHRGGGGAGGFIRSLSNHRFGSPRKQSPSAPQASPQKAMSPMGGRAGEPGAGGLPPRAATPPLKDGSSGGNSQEFSRRSSEGSIGGSRAGSRRVSDSDGDAGKGRPSGEDGVRDPHGGHECCDRAVCSGYALRGQPPLLAFREAPVRVFAGHESDVLELSWSKSNFLLSSSMDKTVRLWHISMDQCLRVFRHNDFVTAVDFHPVDDKYFLSGSLDQKLYIWNIPNQTVADFLDVHEMVTAAAFAPDGRRAVVGTYKGKVLFYSTEGHRFEYITQIDVESKKGGVHTRKITGLQFMPGDSNMLLVTSNDSRIRVYERFTLQCKYKGLKNANSQIRASFSTYGDFIISGSEDECVYLWSTANSFVPSINPMYTGYRKDKHVSYEYFNAHDNVVTVAIFAPQIKKVPLLYQTNPGKPPTGGGVLSALSNAMVSTKSGEVAVAAATAAEEAAVIAAAGYGQVIITAGYNGDIKLFENTGYPTWL